MQERYDELDNIESTLRVLANEVTDEYFKGTILDLMYEAQQEKEVIEPKLLEEQYKEERQQEYQYERSVI